MIDVKKLLFNRFYPMVAMPFTIAICLMFSLALGFLAVVFIIFWLIGW